MLPFMSEYLAARMQYVIAMRSNAMDMIASSTESAIPVWARFIFHVFFEAIL